MGDDPARIEPLGKKVDRLPLAARRPRRRTARRPESPRPRDARCASTRADPASAVSLLFERGLGKLPCTCSRSTSSNTRALIAVSAEVPSPVGLRAGHERTRRRRRPLRARPARSGCNRITPVRRFRHRSMALPGRSMQTVDILGLGAESAVEVGPAVASKPARPDAHPDRFGYCPACSAVFFLSVMTFNSSRRWYCHVVHHLLDQEEAETAEGALLQRRLGIPVCLSSEESNARPSSTISTTSTSPSRLTWRGRSGAARRRRSRS